METAPADAVAAIPVEHFVKCLTDSGLLSPDEVQSAAARLPPTQRKDTRLLAQALVKLQKLTRYQATLLCQGRSKGLVLNNYVILDKIGAGGMGMVFKAKNRRLDRIVALKVLSPAITKRPHAVQRFLREVQAAAQLNHPNIVAAFDAGEDKGVHFLAMELVDGRDLASLVKKTGPLSVPQAVACLVQAARGLEHAHGAGIIHRDIKPHNLLLDSKGVVKILDMGLARFDESATNAPGGADELTQDGTVLGTCDFMAPEQAVNSKNANQRSDVYGLGCTLYYLLTGKMMYAGDTVMEKLLAHRDAPVPSLQDVRPDVPVALDKAYQRMVAKNPEQRFESMAEVIAALESALPSEARLLSLAGLSSAPASRTDYATLSALASAQSGARRKRRWIVAAVAGAAATVLVVTVLALFMMRGPARSTEAAPPGDSASVTRTENDKRVETARDTGKPASGVSDAWVRMVNGLPPKRQFSHFVEKMRDLNPGMRRAGSQRYDQNGIVEVGFDTDAVTDMSPVRASRHLQELRCSGGGDGGKLRDLSAVQELKLRALNCSRNPQITDLTPLKGMPLRRLSIMNTGVSDLSPLVGIQLEQLDMAGTAVRDLTPLANMPLTRLTFRRTQIDDLTPLKGMPLEAILGDIRPKRDMEVLRTLKSLKEINDIPVADFLKKFSIN